TVHATETQGSASTLDSTVYFDGMGQVYKQQREGPNAANPIIEVDTTFDYAGNATTVSRPFFTGGANPETPNWRPISSDAFGRTDWIAERDGSQTKVTYSSGGRSDVKDRRGNTTTFHRNSYGKPIEIDQSVGGQPVVTKYEYDPATQKLAAIVDAQSNRTQAT